MKIVFKVIPIEWLQPGRYQPRTHFATESLQELAQSIATQGLIEPIVVRELAAESYEIIAGERRWRAAMIAGLTELPCVISAYNDEQAAVVSLIENIQRQDLNLIEEATGYRRLLDDFCMQQEDIASLVGKSRSHIANILRLLSLCEPVQEQIRLGKLTLGHARMLVNLKEEQQIILAQQIQTKDWSVRQLEQKVRELKADATQPLLLQKNHDIAFLEMKISEQVGSPVRIINDSETGGWLQIKFFDNDTLAGLLERMGLRYD